MGPILALILLWVSVSIPVTDREMVDHPSEAVSAVPATFSHLSHDHRLCLLLDSSPLWISPGAVPPAEPLVSTIQVSHRLITSASGGATHSPSARAPPRSF